MTQTELNMGYTDWGNFYPYDVLIFLVLMFLATLVCGLIILSVIELLAKRLERRDDREQK